MTAGLALMLILLLHLLPALLAGLLVYELVHLLAPRLKVVRIHQQRGKLVAVLVLALTIALLLTLAIIGLVAFFHSEAGSLPLLLKKIADIIESWRTILPPWIVERFPDDVHALQAEVAQWLRQHAGELQHAGAALGRVIAYILLGVGIGALVSLYNVQPLEALGPFAQSLQERTRRLGDAFRRVVFAQVRIAALNTLLTALYLVVGLRMFGVHLPLTKIIIAITFFGGLLPILGNLLSSTIIVIVSLSVSPSLGITSFVFLVVIHKLEYFLNAHIVGTQVQAHAWELLIAMLVLEAAFGMPGVIAAPIYYAYLKDELSSQHLV